MPRPELIELACFVAAVLFILGLKPEPYSSRKLPSARIFSFAPTP
jgi:hypothetical protein